MIGGIVQWSLNFRLLIVVISAVLVFFGAGSLREMPVDVYPEFAPVTVEIQSEALGLSAHEVAELITVPLEVDLLSNVPWVDIIRSESVAGLSSIEMIFEPGTDLLKARQVVQERLSEALVALPGASRPPQMLQPKSSTSRVMMVGLSSDRLSLIDLSVLARWNIRPRLMGVPGVSNVAIWGQREQQLQVRVDPARLQAQRMPLLQVIDTTANALWASPLSFVEAAVPGTGGFIDTPNQRLGVQHISPIRTPESLSQVVFAERPSLRLSDVATIVEDHQPLIGDAILNNRPGLLLVIEKWPDVGTQEVTREIEEALAAMAPGLPGVQMDSDLYRPANYVDEAFDNVSLALLVAAVLVLALLVLFLFDWRTAVLAAVTIPLSLFAAAIVLDLVGETLNLLTLAGLVAALVLVIDDAMIGAHAAWRSLRTTRGEGESLTSLLGNAFNQAYSPLIFATLIILLVLLPLFVLDGISGAFFPPAALAYGIAVITSAVVAVVVAPALILVLSPGEPSQRSRYPVAGWVRRRYESLVSPLLGAPWLAVAGIAVLAVLGLGLLTQLSRPSLLPPVKERNLLIHWDGVPGTSHPEMTRVVGEAAREIAGLPGVTNVGAHVGRAVTSDQVVGINSGEIWISIDPKADYDATVARLQDAINGYAGLDRALLTYPEERVNHILAGSPKDVVVRVYGEEINALRAQAEAVRNAMSGIDGIVDLTVENNAEEPTVEVQVDLFAAQRAGIKPGDVRRAATTLLSGLQVGSLFQEQKVFEVVVWSTPETRSSVNSVRELLIDTPSGNFVRLGDVANVRIAPNPAVVKRESVSRYVDVTANVNDRNIEEIEDDIESQISKLNFPIEYHAEIVTDKASGFRSTATNALPYIVAAVAGAFLLLQACLKSWRLAAISFLVIPVGLAGGVMAAFIAGGEITIGSYIGFLAVLGLGVRSAISLVGQYQSHDQGSDEPLDKDLAIRGAGERSLPLLMTGLAVCAAMIPVLVAGSIPGLEVIQPMAVVIVGGVITTLLLHLFLLPSLLLRFWSRPEPEAIAL